MNHSPRHQRHLPGAQLSRRRGRKGQALAEFAISVPIVLLITGVAVDFSRVYYYDLAIRDAAFAAARYAGMNPFDDAGIKAAAVSAAPSGVLAAGSVSISSPVVAGCDGTRQTGCPMRINVSYIFSPITPAVTALTGNWIILSRSQTDIVK